MTNCKLCELKPLTPWHYADDVVIICDCLTCGTPMLVFRRHGDIALAEEHHARQKLIELYGKRLIKVRMQARKIKGHRHWHLLLEGRMKIDDSGVKDKAQQFFGSEQLSNRFLYEVLPDRSWEGKPCVIVGGGPSLSDFDWQLLQGWRTIGINRVYERFDPTIIFSMDTRFLRWIMDDKYGHDNAERFARSKAYKVWLCTYNCKLPEDIFILRVWKTYSQGFRAFPATMREGIGHGNNSGYGALNLAVCLGASPIYLLGFDMKYKGLKTHWHEGHPIPHRLDTVNKFMKYFALAAIKTKEMGIEVINLNPASALPYFPKKPFSEILN